MDDLALDGIRLCEQALDFGGDAALFGTGGQWHWRFIQPANAHVMLPSRRSCNLFYPLADWSCVPYRIKPFSDSWHAYDSSPRT